MCIRDSGNPDGIAVRKGIALDPLTALLPFHGDACDIARKIIAPRFGLGRGKKHPIGTRLPVIFRGERIIGFGHGGPARTRWNVFRLGHTAFIMDMLFDFRHAAGQVFVFIKASMGVGMQDDLFFPADPVSYTHLYRIFRSPSRRRKVPK